MYLRYREKTNDYVEYLKHNKKANDDYNVGLDGNNEYKIFRIVREPGVEYEKFDITEIEEVIEGVLEILDGVGFKNINASYRSRWFDMILVKEKDIPAVELKIGEQEEYCLTITEGGAGQLLSIRGAYDRVIEEEIHKMSFVRNLEYVFGQKTRYIHLMSYLLDYLCSEPNSDCLENIHYGREKIGFGIKVDNHQFVGREYTVRTGLGPLVKQMHTALNERMIHGEVKLSIVIALIVMFVKEYIDKESEGDDSGCFSEKVIELMAKDTYGKRYEGYVFDIKQGKYINLKDSRVSPVSLVVDTREYAIAICADIGVLYDEPSNTEEIRDYIKGLIIDYASQEYRGVQLDGVIVDDKAPWVENMIGFCNNKGCMIELIMGLDNYMSVMDEAYKCLNDNTADVMYDKNCWV